MGISLPQQAQQYPDPGAAGRHPALGPMTGAAPLPMMPGATALGSMNPPMMGAAPPMTPRATYPMQGVRMPPAMPGPASDEITSGFKQAPNAVFSDLVAFSVLQAGKTVAS